MKNRERVFHAVSFEIILLAIFIPMSALVTQKPSGDLAIVGVSLSLLAVAWNYVYNIGFDKLFGAERIQRGMKLRVLHAVCFEAGMVVLGVPLIAWMLQISLLAAIILEAGFLVFILIYTLLFNWLYDHYQPYKNWFGEQKA
ncbi:PACE efflux transporter [Leucothrix mucor]|uniref:PACE efflux transporter n=1 Tax=Leucothrix mucor TaxID=45248 RepID=UPI0003B67419|nr:PACE efflux transporter [Leucothrix mucor]